MSFELIVFISPEADRTFLVPDSGIVLTGHPATHSSGRPGIGFTIPDGTPNSNGCKIRLEKEKKPTIEQRAILFLRTADWETKYPWGPGQTAAIAVDDFHFGEDLPEPPPNPIPPDPNPTPKTPVDIINAVYATGLYNLSTKSGCGQFTEACCAALHVQHSDRWGHIKKIPPQNHYPEVPYTPGGNVHAVDAIQLLIGTPDTAAGVYDIIISSEAPDARPSFQFKGPAEPTLWYFPAK